MITLVKVKKYYLKIRFVIMPSTLHISDFYLSMVSVIFDVFNTNEFLAHHALTSSNILSE